ncbi:MAG: hypothetical protein MPK62_14430 [Alphaproteobacteria bacterium]|nr:hypothetical protein [Alphaproteobacteria bacterium]
MYKRQVSVDALLPSSKGGKVLVPLENHYSVAADLEAGTCVGNVTVITRDQSVEELAETMTFTKEEKSKDHCLRPSRPGA